MKRRLGNLTPPESSALDAIVTIAREHRHSEVIVWGPSLVRAVLSGDDRRHRLRSLEERHHILDVLRRLVHHTHAELDIEPDWWSATLAALEHARGPFLAGAKSEAEIAREKLLDAVSELFDGQDVVTALDVTALPAEDLSAVGLREDIARRVRELGRLIDIAVDAMPIGLPNVRSEVRTVARRILRRAAENDPALFARRSRNDTIAGGIAVAAAEHNGAEHMRSTVCVTLGTNVGATVSRGHDLLRAAGAARRRAPLGLPEGAECAWMAYPSLLVDPTLQIADTRRLIRETYELIADEGDEEEAGLLHLMPMDEA